MGNGKGYKHGEWEGGYKGIGKDLFFLFLAFGSISIFDCRDKNKTGLNHRNRRLTRGS